VLVIRLESGGARYAIRELEEKEDQIFLSFAKNVPNFPFEKSCRFIFDVEFFWEDLPSFSELDKKLGLDFLSEKEIFRWVV
jgi:hypothetical protein